MRVIYLYEEWSGKIVGKYVCVEEPVRGVHDGRWKFIELGL